MPLTNDMLRLKILYHSIIMEKRGKQLRFLVTLLINTKLKVCCRRLRTKDKDRERVGWTILEPTTRD